MSLASALSTALTGLSAAESTIAVVGNNLANANTVGFKESDATFATQFLQTQSVGSAPTADNGGQNPFQEGLGVSVAEVAPNFTQGTIELANSPTDLAVQGNGFFIVQGSAGATQYTRNGTFSTNSENQLVDSSGNRVMGYGVTNNFDIDSSQLQPLQIPLGTASVAKATTTASLQGTLSSSGAVATTAQVIESNVFTDDSLSYPQSGPTTALAVDNNGNPVAGNLSGNYTYYVTYVSGNTQSRPQLVGAETPLLDNNQVTLTNIPTDTTGQWTSTDIYRSVNNPPGNTNFYLVGTLPSTTDTSATFTDNSTDAQIIANDQTLNFNGPPATASTPLSDLVQYDGSNYNQIFSSLGTLGFTGTLGGTTLSTQNMQITSASTLGDLATFLQNSLGIQGSPGTDPNNPIPTDAGTGLGPGAYVTSSGQLEIVGNNGTANAVGIGVSALKLTPTGSTQATAIDLPFNTTQTAIGQSTSTDMVAYDSLGNPLSVHITADMEKQTSDYTEYRWYADCGQNDPGNGQQGIAVGTGVLFFNGQGDLISASNTTVSIGRANDPAVKPMQFNLDFSQVSGLASTTSSLAVANQDGAAPGVLNSFTISGTGLISGVFSNGISQNLGQVRLARFSNPTGLEQEGQNLYSAGVNSGLPIEGDPGEQGTGSVVAGSLELSNTDIGASLISLITAQTTYGANAKVITTTTNLFDTLLQLLPAG